VSLVLNAARVPVPEGGSRLPPLGKVAIGSRMAEVNGTRLHYLIAGQGEPVLLLHGYAQTSHMWRPLIAELAKTHTVVAPDLRGFGDSAKSDGGYDKKTMAQDVHDLAASLGHRRLAVVGHDIGLMVAYAYAAQYPEEVERIVLMDAFLPGVASGRTSGCSATCGISTSMARRRWRWSTAVSASTSSISGTSSRPIPHAPEPAYSAAHTPPSDVNRASHNF
jgi:pimeloyl-ACP methyl ester carboxylesterase